jgi:hypothetical protein
VLQFGVVLAAVKEAPSLLPTLSLAQLAVEAAQSVLLAAQQPRPLVLPGLLAHSAGAVAVAILVILPEL